MEGVMPKHLLCRLRLRFLPYARPYFGFADRL